MVILPQIVKLKWNPKNKNYYEAKGYIFTKWKDEFNVDVKDLSCGSKVKIKCKCDNCNIEITYNNNKNILTEKTYCNKCISIKNKNTCIQKYGVDSPIKCKEIKEKIDKTNLERYGTTCTFKNVEIKKKAEQTILKKYGVNNAFQSKEIQEKAKDTCLKKYNVEYGFQSKEIQEKIKQTNIKQYNCENPMQRKEIKEKAKQTCLKRYGVEIPAQNPIIMNKMLDSLYKNNSGPCSKQQKHIHNLIGGELNSPLDKCLLDIAFPEEMIYIEYDGGGHNLSVKLGTMTQEEFDKKELKRQYYLRSLGWKLIRLKCESDKLPNDKELVSLINDSKIKLKYISHINIDLNLLKR